MRLAPFLFIALMGAAPPQVAPAGGFEKLIEICLQGSLERNIEITGETLAAELDSCLSTPEALEFATIAETFPACREAGNAAAIAACLVEDGLG